MKKLILAIVLLMSFTSHNLLAGYNTDPVRTISQEEFNETDPIYLLINQGLVIPMTIDTYISLSNTQQQIIGVASGDTSILTCVLKVNSITQNPNGSYHIGFNVCCLGVSAGTATAVVTGPDGSSVKEFTINIINPLDGE